VSQIAGALGEGERSSLISKCCQSGKKKKEIQKLLGTRKRKKESKRGGAFTGGRPRD